MTSIVSAGDPPSISKDVNKPSKSTFRPSQNWTALQKSLPQQSSKKRKRTSKPTSTTSVQIKREKTLTTYNPWHPNDTPSRKLGNSALVLPSQTGDKVLKYVIARLCSF